MFAGPRVRIGIHYATPGTFAYRLNTDGSLSITGMAYKYTEALSDAGAGGQVLLSHTAWQQLRGVEGCPCGGFPVMQQLGLFQLDGPFSPDWVYEVCVISVFVRVCDVGCCFCGWGCCCIMEL